MAIIRRPMLLAVTLVVVCCAQADAVIVFEKGKDDPVRGYLVETNDERVIIDELLPDGRKRRRIIPRSQVEDVRVGVKPDELAELNYEEPKTFYDQAELLAGRKADPEARDEALRLFLIAAYLAPDEYGGSSLLNMVALARSVDEQRRFSAMAFIIDSEHDASRLAAPTASDGGSEARRRQLVQIRTALRLLRSNLRDRARTIMSDATLRETFGQFRETMTISEFDAAARGEAGPLPKLLLFKVLTLEASLYRTSADDRRDVGNVASAPWSQLVANGVAMPVKPLSLETLTEFDPRACVYNDGRWVAPRE